MLFSSQYIRLKCFHYMMEQVLFLSFLWLCISPSLAWAQRTHDWTSIWPHYKISPRFSAALREDCVVDAQIVSFMLHESMNCIFYFFFYKKRNFKILNMSLAHIIIQICPVLKSETWDGKCNLSVAVLERKACFLMFVKLDLIRRHTV